MGKVERFLAERKNYFHFSILLENQTRLNLPKYQKVIKNRVPGTKIAQDFFVVTCLGCGDKNPCEREGRIKNNSIRLRSAIPNR